jgi:hypothetical protein
MLTRIFIFLICVTASTTSSAAILYYDYTGTSHSDPDVTVAGTFGYDNLAGDNSSSDPNIGEYTGAGFWTGTISNGPANGSTFNFTNLDIEIINNDQDFEEDSFSMSLSSAPQTYIFLTDDDQTAFSGDNLPALLTLDEFEFFEMSLYVVADANIHQLFFDIDSISAPTVVPLPPAIWLFGSALLGLVGWSRGKKTT